MKGSSSLFKESADAVIGPRAQAALEIYAAIEAEKGRVAVDLLRASRKQQLWKRKFVARDFDRTRRKAAETVGKTQQTDCPRRKPRECPILWDGNHVGLR
jgi:hypothetical protein